MHKGIYRKAALFLFLICGMVSISSAAESAPVRIEKLRVHSPNNRAYIHLAGAGAFSMTVYSIELSAPAGREIFSTALTALNSGKNIVIEVPTCANNQCSYGVVLTSIYILN